ncbi:helix-turn-helix domain-containing protein [Streptomyces sp. NPDC087525]|uniref:AraC family transcriptional regulator n=1 Tax=Streptomyces sp. NPDC087525 TaxID=3365793 RepID=UPI0037F29F92
MSGYGQRSPDGQPQGSPGGQVRGSPGGQVTLCLDSPPRLVDLGVGIHGVSSDRDVFVLPGLWQLHLYRYAADLTVDGVPYAVRPGRVSLVPPGSPVEFRYRGRSEHLYAHFELADEGERLSVPVMQDAGAGAPALNSRLSQAVAAATHSPVRAVPELWSALWQVALLGRRPGTDQPHASVAAAVAYIESRLHEPLTVPEVARAANVSHNHLLRLFRADLDSTVVAYVRRRRMDRARHLLTESTLSIPAIAAAVGMPDLQAFNKACRRELRASPRAVRAGAA